MTPSCDFLTLLKRFIKNPNVSSEFVFLLRVSLKNFFFFKLYYKMYQMQSPPSSTPPCTP